MARRSFFLQSFQDNSASVVAAAASVAKPKAAGTLASEGGSLAPQPGGSGFALDGGGVPPPPAGASDPQIAEWRARYGVGYPNVQVPGSPESARLNPLSLLGQVWRSFSVDRPVIIRVADTGLTGLVFYAPHTVPADTKHAQRMSGAGIIYIPTPGLWHLYYNSASASDKVDATVIDATDAAVAVRYLSEQGAAYWSNVIVTAPIAGGASIELVPANRDRKGLIVQNLDAANAVALRMVEGASVPTIGFAGGAAVFRIGPGGELFFTGEQAARGRMVVQSTAAATVLVATLQQF